MRYSFICSPGEGEGERMREKGKEREEEKEGEKLTTLVVSKSQFLFPRGQLCFISVR